MPAKVERRFHAADIAEIVQMTESAVRRHVSRGTIPLELDVDYGRLGGITGLSGSGVRNHVHRGRLDIASLESVVLLVLAYGEREHRQAAFRAFGKANDPRPVDDLSAVVCFVCRHAPPALYESMFDALTRLGDFAPPGNKLVKKKRKKARRRRPA